VASAAPARAHLVGGRAHVASAAVSAAAMHQSPHRMPVLDPPLLLGPPPPVGQRQQQHSDVDWSCACVVLCCGVWVGSTWKKDGFTISIANAGAKCPTF